MIVEWGDTGDLGRGLLAELWDREEDYVRGHEDAKDAAARLGDALASTGDDCAGVKPRHRLGPSGKGEVVLSPGDARKVARLIERPGAPGGEAHKRSA